MTKRKNPDGRLPWAQWDFDSWTTDAELALCSMAAQGFWMRLLALAWKNDGYVLVGGKAPSSRQLAALTNQKIEDVEKWVEELLENGVASVGGWPGATNVLFSRRMVRDFRTRKKARENGAKGGNPNLKPANRSTPSRPEKGQPQKGLFPEIERTNPDGVNLEIEIEIERERESESVSNSARAKSAENAGGENRATWDNLEYRGDTLRTVLEAEKIGEVRKDEEGRKGEVWFMASGVMRVLGQMTDKAARQAVGEITRTHGLEPDELAEIALAAFDFGPNNPRAYFASQAAKIVARRK